MALVLEVDNQNLSQFVGTVAAYGTDRFGYVVTPNADHLIRFHDDPSFRELYLNADYVLLDSRFLAYLLRLTRGIRLPVCTGSDLTAQVVGSVLKPDDVILLVGGSNEQAAELARKYRFGKLRHLNPPMGFIRDEAEVEKVLDFVEANSPFRICFLAVGSPQQEVVARRIATRGKARGLALCIGASINFLTNAERRAPLFMQRLGIEWLYRLLQDPRRMGKRYLVRGPRVFGVLRKLQLNLRDAKQVAGG